MNATTTLIETRLATMERVGPGLIVQRFRAGVKLDLVGFEENRVARHTLAEHGPHAMLTVFPEGIDFDLAVTTRDHFKPEQDKSDASPEFGFSADELSRFVEYINPIEEDRVNFAHTYVCAFLPAQ